MTFVPVKARYCQVDKLIERNPLMAYIEVEKCFANLFDGLGFLRLHFNITIILFPITFFCKNQRGGSDINSVCIVTQ